MNKLISVLFCFQLLSAMESDQLTNNGSVTDQQALRDFNTPGNPEEDLVTEREATQEGKCSIGVQTPWDMLFSDPRVVKVATTMAAQINEENIAFDELLDESAKLKEDSQNLWTRMETLTKENDILKCRLANSEGQGSRSINNNQNRNMFLVVGGATLAYIAKQLLSKK